MQDVMKANVIRFKEEVEEICDGADKQLTIEKKMSDLREQWAGAVFEFSMWKTRDVPVLKAFGQVGEEWRIWELVEGSVLKWGRGLALYLA